MKDNIQLAREKTRNSVADITGWCMVVALHQRFGMGRDRLERLAGTIDRIQDEVTAKMDTEGFAAGMEMLTRRELAAGVKIENIGRRLPYDFC